MPDVGGVAELGATTGGVADPLVAADPVLLTWDGGRGKRGRGTPIPNPSLTDLPVEQLHEL